jgi:hypothetical protein
MQQTYLIPMYRLSELSIKIAKLDKKSRKLGCGAIVLEEHGEVWRKRNLGHGRSCIEDFMVVSVTGEAPKFAGWSFMAKVVNGAWLGDAVGAIVSSLPSVTDLPAQYRADVIDPCLCEHCGKSRKRKDTFLVRHEDGSWKQIGRQCLRDFLGHQNPDSLARGCELLFDAMGACDEDEREDEGGGSRAHCLFPVAEFLALCAANIRLHGWVSSKVAREEEGVRSTTERAFSELIKAPTKAEDITPVLEIDHSVATAALAWAQESLVTQTSDYALNMRNALASGVVSSRTRGLVGSLIGSYLREKELLIKKKYATTVSSYVGEVGKRVTLELTLTRTHSWDTDWGTQVLYSFIDADGNVLVWKTSGDGLQGGSDAVEVGDSVQLKATIKAHDEYRDVKQTKIARATVLKHTKMNSESTATSEP